MRPINIFKTLICAAATVLAGCSGADVGDQTDFTREKVERPPQHVLISFDGSKSHSFWETSRAFARDHEVKFTYFISGVYFLTQDTKRIYDGPTTKAGYSAIGFGNTNEGIESRLHHIEAAYQEGHEIGSHANGHFDGSGWTRDQWLDEFEQFDQLVFNAGENNGFAAPELSFGADSILGFRAPQLGRGDGLYAAMAAHGMQYDTSRVRGMSYWPKKLGGVWDFPLASVKIVGSGKNTLSMDYNFYVAQSGASKDVANKELYKQQMIDTYMAYFENNYFGNRAPVDIGHHFSRWNGGAYWEALQVFIQRVCHLPEVKCVRYIDLVSFLEDNSEKLDAYREGRFNPMPRPPSANGAPAEDVSEEETEALLEGAEPHDCHGDHDEE